jgi:trehalose 6-phosphate phosphatase
MLGDMPDPLAAFRARPESSGLFLDFDGVLSEIVPVPSEARPAPGVTELLSDLGEAMGVVVVVSGRRAAELLEWLGPSVEIWGVHGAERTVDGRVVLSERALPYRDLMHEVARRATTRLEPVEGVSVEDKAVVTTLHYRVAQDKDAARRAVVEAASILADRHGLSIHEGRQSLELRPPVELSKSAVVLDRARSAGVTAALFVGDDTVDLPAFDALDELAREGVSTLRVAVRSDESPEELLRRADVVLEGPPGVVEFLADLARPQEVSRAE